MTCRIDLHMHSDVSTDGEKTPGELVEIALRAGLECIALADHNRVAGVEAAVRAGGDRLRVIPCVELDCGFEDLDLHVLGYHIDVSDPEYARVWEDVAAGEAAASQERMELVRRIGIALDMEVAAKAAIHGVVTAEIIAEIALADPRNDGNPVLAPYRPGGSRSDNPYVNFYWDICSRGKPGYVPVPFMCLADAIRLIRRTGGVPVLAHPGQTLRSRRDVLPALVREGIRGIEAYSSYHSPSDSRSWEAEAEANGILITCGSDYHGKTKPAIAMGSHGCARDGREIEAQLHAARA